MITTELLQGMLEDWREKHATSIADHNWRAENLAPFWEFLDDSGATTWPKTDADVSRDWDWLVMDNLDAIRRGQPAIDLRECPIKVVDWHSWFKATDWVTATCRKRRLNSHSLEHIEQSRRQLVSQGSEPDGTSGSFDQNARALR